MKKRVISACIMLLIFIPLLMLGGIFFKVGLSVLSALSLKEVLDIKKNIPRYIKIITYILVILLTLFDINMMTKIFVFMFVLLILLVFSDNKNYSIEEALYLLGFSILITSIFSYMYLIRQRDINVLVYLFLITVFTDTFAYIGGRLFGKHKLIPRISPNKTIEGSVIGSLIGTIISSIFYLYMVSPGDNFILIIIFTLVLSIIGQFGDLVFSSIKRHYKIKDFSNLIPGHGGILDRFDSITFVILGYIIIINFL